MVERILAEEERIRAAEAREQKPVMVAMRIRDAIAVGFWVGFGFSLWGVVLYIVYEMLF